MRGSPLAASLDRRLEVAMRRRDHAHVDPRAPRRADRQAFPALEKSQTHGLGSQRQLADLVQEHGAAVHASDTFCLF
jgi:hypothetical protein